jgi:hypothetical protein
MEVTRPLYAHLRQVHRDMPVSASNSATPKYSAFNCRFGMIGSSWLQLPSFGNRTNIGHGCVYAGNNMLLFIVVKRTIFLDDSRS